MEAVTGGLQSAGIFILAGAWLICRKLWDSARAGVQPTPPSSSQQI